MHGGIHLHSGAEGRNISGINNYDIEFLHQLLQEENKLGLVSQ